MSKHGARLCSQTYDTTDKLAVRDARTTLKLVGEMGKACFLVKLSKKKSRPLPQKNGPFFISKRHSIAVSGYRVCMNQQNFARILNYNICSCGRSNLLSTFLYGPNWLHTRPRPSRATLRR